MNTFTEWNAELVRDRIIEMAETMRICPRVKGPKSYGNAMPEPVQSREDAYGYHSTRYTKTPSAAALSRMEQTWTWINRLECQDDRELLYGWSWIKVRKGFTLAAYAENLGMNDRFLLRKILVLCHQISEQLNRHRSIRLNNEGLHMSETQPDITPRHVSSGNRASSWAAPDARPHIDPAAPSSRTLDHRAIRVR